MRSRSLVPLNSQTARGVRPMVSPRRMAALASLAALMAHRSPIRKLRIRGLETSPSRTRSRSRRSSAGWPAALSKKLPDSAERNIDDDMSFGIFLNMMADVPERQYELFYVKQGTMVEGSVPMDLDVSTCSSAAPSPIRNLATCIPMSGRRSAAPVSPIRQDSTTRRRSRSAWVAVCAFPITQHFGLRLDFRGFITLLQDDTDIFCVFDPANASACAIKPKGDTLVQYTASFRRCRTGSTRSRG